MSLNCQIINSLSAVDEIWKNCYCLKCFDSKNVVVASSDAEIYSVVQGDIKTNRLCQKKLIKN
jgi:hypothetical protein